MTSTLDSSHELGGKRYGKIVGTYEGVSTVVELEHEVKTEGIELEKEMKTSDKMTAKASELFLM